MTDLFEPVDAHDRDLALGSSGLLGRANAAGVVTAADVHVARALGMVGGEQDPRVLLAVALTSRAVRSGSVCLDLAAPEGVGGLDAETASELGWPEVEAWADAVASSPLVAAGVLRWESGLLYLDRYHEQETQVLHDLAARAASAPDHDADLMTRTLDRVFPEEGYDEQRAACASAARQWLTVVTGGPGTGKTTAVAGLLVALHEQLEARGERLRVALTAPTGKAAARLQESLDDARLGEADRGRLVGIEAMTLHRLLRPLPSISTRFRHDRSNRLPHDVVVVDETSMVSLTMMARLLEAVRPDARLVLVGDPDQLASVEAGAVLGDIVAGYSGRPDSPVAALRTSHRFVDRIGDLAAAVRDGDADAAIEVLATGSEGPGDDPGDDPAPVRWIRDARDPAVRRTVLGPALAARDAARDGDPARALRALASHRLLCAHRDGPHGVRHWNRRIEQWLTAETGDLLHDPDYPGRPLLVTANDHALRVYNGDSGIVVSTPDGRRVALPGRDAPRLLAPSRLGDVETMHAMTIHKSQGSQARSVTVVLPDEESRLLTRELFYTAVTRAQEQVVVVGEEAWVRAAIERRARRASGLAPRIAASPPAPPPGGPS